MKLNPTIMRLGGWLFLLPYALIGIHVLLLTTVGRKTGKLRTSMLMHSRADQDYIIAAHGGGSHSHPKWSLTAPLMLAFTKCARWISGSGQWKIGGLQIPLEPFSHFVPIRSRKLSL